MKHQPIAHNAYCSRDIYLQFTKYLRPVILPSIIQMNAPRRVSLVKINAGFFPVGNMTDLINLKMAEHRNKKLFVYCFQFAIFLTVYKTTEVVCPKISLRRRGKLLSEVARGSPVAFNI